MESISDYFGNIDIYLFDQIQKERFTPQMRILDAGCGGGRNIVYLMRIGCDVAAIDQSPEAVEQVRKMADDIAPDLPDENFRTAAVEEIPFQDEDFDWVICNTVLHFAYDPDHFDVMLREMWRVLKPGGMFFSRLASSIGIEDLIIRNEDGRYKLPDGSTRFLVDQVFLLSKTEELGATLIEPIKTTNVQNLRAMTTWVLRK
ncbi:MAG: class I SAM-dependent methyltransferase [Acidobacteria bacterium]|nr:class I SAM-dependent methyltransferase [Acidobacteriota bacterium]